MTKPASATATNTKPTDMRATFGFLAGPTPNTVAPRGSIR